MTLLLAAVSAAIALWHPTPGASFQIQLQGTVDTSVPAAVYEIDGTHARGLGIGLKNDPDQAAALEPSFDFSVAEQCFQYQECGKLSPFVSAGKAVFDIEHKLAPSAFCSQTAALGLTALKKKLSLNAWRTACP